MKDENANGHKIAYHAIEGCIFKSLGNIFLKAEFRCEIHLSINVLLRPICKCGNSINNLLVGGRINREYRIQVTWLPNRKISHGKQCHKNAIDDHVSAKTANTHAFDSFYHILHPRVSISLSTSHKFRGLAPFSHIIHLVTLYLSEIIYI